jgi:hypothetical protein
MPVSSEMSCAHLETCKEDTPNNGSNEKELRRKKRMWLASQECMPSSQEWIGQKMKPYKTLQLTISALWSNGFQAVLHAHEWK